MNIGEYVEIDKLNCTRNMMPKTNIIRWKIIKNGFLESIKIKIIYFLT